MDPNENLREHRILANVLADHVLQECEWNVIES